MDRRVQAGMATLTPIILLGKGPVYLVSTWQPMQLLNRGITLVIRLVKSNATGPNLRQAESSLLFE
jgi:hypothetical protein